MSKLKKSGPKDSAGSGPDMRGKPHPHGSFALSGPIDRSADGDLPVRGDLAHVGLAGRYLVPHYAIPQPRAVMPGGAPLHTSPDAASPETCTLLEGDSFEVLDVTGDWAWGCLSLDGPTGYVRTDRLETLA